MPADYPSGPNSHHRWIEFHVQRIAIVNIHGLLVRFTRGDGNCAMHKRMDLAVIIERARRTEGRLECPSQWYRATVECGNSARATHEMEEQRHVQYGLWLGHGVNVRKMQIFLEIEWNCQKQMASTT